ncbi:MAG: phenylalanine--tRNA ligase subunit beta [Cardiobacteriaceae bacterium]|nr:phenylalanine--tRNA ligase subunit beta [Cardiobacteriaceae bacterium]
MLLSTDWLKEDYGIVLSAEVLADRLTMAGLEVDGVTYAAPFFSGVVVAQVLTLTPHPDADKLRVATVDAGNDHTLQIVCGATNIAVGIKVPLATIGACLPGDINIKKSKLRGVESQGMLCSARELGLSEDHTGLFILPEDAPLGADVRDYLHLNDAILDIDLTPNRADCFSMRGLAREISLLCADELGNNFRLPTLDVAVVDGAVNTALEITNHAPEDCPCYKGRIIREVDISQPTPTYIVERLRRAGIRTHDPIVDITNYVMLLLGTPLHAFDADKIQGGVVIRRALHGEKLRLLNDSEVQLDDDVLLIADAEKPLAIAGVMGGAESACTEATRNIILEAAWFNPPRIAGKARRFALSSDSAQRFERGVDYTLQETAIHLATRLILEICGGNAEKVCSVENERFFPQRLPIVLSKDAITHRIGRDYENKDIERILTGLGNEVLIEHDKWTIMSPAWRFDLTIAEDVIEEIARIDGYSNIPDRLPAVVYQNGAGENQSLRYYSDLLVAQGFQEAVTYSFIDRKSHQIFFPNVAAITLQNPISTNLAEMRMSLLPGLVNALSYNRNRQQQDLRLFEVGRIFLSEGEKQATDCQQNIHIAGIMSGLAEPEQWSVSAREIDFFDVKGVVEQLLWQLSDLTYRPSRKSYLHPGKSADVYDEKGNYLGSLGALHPQILQQIDIKGNEAYVFEVETVNLLPQKHLPRFESISKYPTVRRDLALIVDKSISSADILSAVRKKIGKILFDVYCFDLYQNASLGDKQSLALAMLLQNQEKTLQDEEVESIMNNTVDYLKITFNAELR